MGIFDGMFGGGFMPQMPQDPAMPMAINQDGQSGQGLFGGMLSGAQNGQGGMFGQGGGLLGLGFGGQGNKPIYDLGGQGSGLLGFGSPGQNPMMQYGLNMASPGMGQMFAPQQQAPQQPPTMKYDQQMFAPKPPDYAFRGGFASPYRRA
jgi:hypothetical protein